MTSRRFFSTIVFLSLVLISSSLSAQTKIDPFFDTLIKINKPKATQAKASTIGGSGQGSQNLEAFIKTNDADATRLMLESLGGTARAIVSDHIMTAEIPADSLEALQNHPSIEFIEAAKPVEMRNDVAMVEINGYEVHQGVDMDRGYTGEGVIIGVVDTGIDLDHNDFLDEEGNSRIIFAWDQQGTGGDGPSELYQTYGTECDTEEIANGTCDMRDTKGHGTHIAGTLAGRDPVYGGVAPDADIIAVRYRSELIIDGYATPLFSTTVCEAAYYVFKKAESLGRPAVVNLSLGTHIGPHDGTSLFEQCIDALVEGSSGRVVVAAAGNEHINHQLFTGIHAGYDVAGAMGTNFRIRTISEGNVFYLDTWMTHGSDLSFGLVVRDAGSGTELGSTPMVAPGETLSGAFDGDNIMWQISAGETTSVLNGKPHVGITVALDSSVTNPQVYDFDLLVMGSGHFDAWWYPDKSSSAILFTNLSGDSGRGFTYMPGDHILNVATPATAKTVIAVGGYASKTQWDKGNGCCQVAFLLGDILPFSSVGPSTDPGVTGQKPTVTAPGAMIASARSLDAESDVLMDLADGEHTLAAGTSMASPFVAGTAALILSSDPNYTYADIMTYISQSAYSDEYTGSVPNDSWGYGKLDVLAAVQTAVLGGPTGSALANSDLSPPEGSSGGGSGGGSSCSMISGQRIGHHIIPALLSILSMAGVLWSTRRHAGKQSKQGKRRSLKTK